MSLATGGRNWSELSKLSPELVPRNWSIAFPCELSKLSPELPSNSSQQLLGRQDQFGSPLKIRIDEAVAQPFPFPDPAQALRSEDGPGAVAQQSFAAGFVPRRNPHLGVEAETPAMAPGFEIIDHFRRQQAAPSEESERTGTDRFAQGLGIAVRQLRRVET